MTHKILVYAIFATGFCARPFGGALFGYIGDIRGRKLAFQVSLTVMAISTFLIGCIPNFDTFSYASPILLLLCVIAQGLSKGGQVGSVFVYIYETAPRHRRAFWISLILVSSFGAFSCTAVKIVIDASAPRDYGWRISSWIGISLWPIVCVSEYALRRTPTFEQMQRDRDRLNLNRYPNENENGFNENEYRNPFLLSLVDHWMVTVSFIGASALSQGYSALLYIFLPHYLSTTEWIERKKKYDAFEDQGYLIMVTIVVVVISGFLADQHNHRYVFIMLSISAIGTFVISPFIWSGYTMTSEEWQDVLLSMTMMMVTNVTNGVVFFWYIDSLLIDPKTRTRIFGVAYNIGALLFAGTAPLLGAEFINMGGVFVGSLLNGIWLSLLALTSLVWYCYVERVGKETWAEEMRESEERNRQLEEERVVLTATEELDSDL